MTTQYSEVLANAQNMVDSIYKSMAQIEAISDVIDKVEKGRLGFSLEGGLLTMLDELTEAQKEEVKELVLEFLHRNIHEAIEFLDGTKNNNMPLSRTETPVETCSVSDSTNIPLDTEKPVETITVPVEVVKKAEPEASEPKKARASKTVSFAEQILEMHAEGLPASQIIETLGCDRSTVYHLLKQKGLKPNKAPKASKHELTEDWVEIDDNAVKGMYEGGASCEEIAAAIGADTKETRKDITKSGYSRRCAKRVS